MKAIETAYKGFRFRSRLEARWAVFFDALGLRWEYEREGYELPSGRYLPDFFVHWDGYKSARLLQFREVGYWIEIKGCEPSAQELLALGELAVATSHIAYLCVGEPMSARVFVAGIKGDVREWALLPPGGIHLCAFVDCCPEVPPSSEQIDAAMRAARAARFEFGETPS